jgi:hypothetical protein
VAEIAAWKVPSTLYVWARARWSVRRRVARRVCIESDGEGDMFVILCEVFGRCVGDVCR